MKAIRETIVQLLCEKRSTAVACVKPENQRGRSRWHKHGQSICFALACAGMQCLSEANKLLDDFETHVCLRQVGYDSNLRTNGAALHLIAGAPCGVQFVTIEKQLDNGEYGGIFTTTLLEAMARVDVACHGPSNRYQSKHWFVLSSEVYLKPFKRFPALSD